MKIFVIWCCALLMLCEFYESILCIVSMFVCVLLECFVHCLYVVCVLLEYFIFYIHVNVQYCVRFIRVFIICCVLECFVLLLILCTFY